MKAQRQLMTGKRSMIKKGPFPSVSEHRMVHQPMLDIGRAVQVYRRRNREGGLCVGPNVVQVDASG